MTPEVWIARLCGLFRKTKLDSVLEEDIREHLEMATEENIRRGMTPREAALAARRTFGGVDQMKEEFRDQRGIPAIETFLREIWFATRSLRRAPGFTFLAIVTLAIGIGANAAIFSAVNALLFNPAGISEAGRTVVIRSKYEKLNLNSLVISLNDWKDVSAGKEVFSAAAVSKPGDYNYTGSAYPQRLSALHTSQQWVEVFGIKPILGRAFSGEETRPNGPRVAILSHALWTRLYSSDPGIVGKAIELDEKRYQIVGVMPAEATFAIDQNTGLSSQAPDLLLPLTPIDRQRENFTETFLGVARLKPGVGFDRAQAYMQLATKRGYEMPGLGKIRQENGWGLFAVPYTDFVGGDMKTPLLILWGAVGMVLLIACANIAGLTLARTSARVRELAVRKALGGSRWHVMRQMLAESALLALAGSIAGLGVAKLSILGVKALAPENVAGSLQIPFDLRLVVFAAVGGLVSAMLFGIVPALQAARGTTSDGLKEGGRSGTAGSGRARMRTALVTMEVALALVLSIGAGLLLRSLNRLGQVDVGFRPQGVMSAMISLPEAHYPSAERIVQFFRAAADRLKQQPGVRAAAMVHPLPFGIGFEGRAFQIVGKPVGPNQPARQASMRRVSPEYFSLLRIPLLRGRVFTEQDTAGTERVAIIDEALARQYWPEDDPLGQRLQQQNDSGPMTIVGVVGATRQADLASQSERGLFYLAFNQDPLAFGSLIVQRDGNGEGAVNAIRDAVHSLDAGQPIYDVKSMDQRIADTLAGRRFTVSLLALFALTAVFLAALGLYGVINYGVTQRTQEIGIRMALGAQSSQVMGLVVGQGLRIAVVGLALGWGAAYVVAGRMPNQLFGVGAFDAFTFLVMAVLLAGVALLASYVPARRAMKLDPLEACRHE